MSQRAPCIMVTGSHIPDDRNGLKFYRADGEIDKNDEQAISTTHAALPLSLSFRHQRDIAENDAAIAAYTRRYVDFVGRGSLRGLHVGVYQHSSVARDLMTRILAELGAKTIALGRSDVFVPVDTEALRPEDIGFLAGWAKENRFDAIVSTDGDADRPLIADENGRFVRGDLVGAITANWIGADTIVTPVTSNAALEETGRFAHVVRTRVGSPYVIEGMARAAIDGAQSIVGFEANGGVLLGSAANRQGRELAALPTRDALLPILACLSTVSQEGKPLSKIGADFQFRATLSDRLQNVPGDRSRPFLRMLEDETARRKLFPAGDRILRSETIDGVKLFSLPAIPSTIALPAMRPNCGAMWRQRIKIRSPNFWPWASISPAMQQRTSEQ